MSVLIEGQGISSAGVIGKTEEIYSTGHAIHIIPFASDGLTANPLPVSSSYSVPTTITRPANATPYTLNDCLGGVIDLGVLGPSGENIYITDITLEYDVAALPAGFSAVLHLYNVTPPSAFADNGAWDLVSGDRASHLDSIQLTVPTDLGSTLKGSDSNLNKKFKLSGTHLFGYLVVTAFTPAGNSEVLVLTVHTTRC